MASNAHMLLNPRAYRKHLSKNGNDPEALLSSPEPSPVPCAGPEAQDEQTTSLYSSTRRSPTPPDDPEDFAPEPEDSLLQGTGQQKTTANGQRRGAAPPMAPQGTSSVAHRLLSPQRPPSVTRASSRSLYPSSAGSTSGSTSPQSSSHFTPDLDVQFTSASGVDVNDGKRSGDSVELDDSIESRHGNLIENMYGVERRTGTPHKRVKTEHERTEGVKRPPIAGNSGLGEYMREDDGETPSSTAITPDVVDLTLGE